jgi:hypothetical protein
VNFEKVLDPADPIEADDEYHVEEVISSMESQSIVTYLVNLREFPAKKYWTHETYSSCYSVGAKKELKKFHSESPKALRDPVFKIKK